jgi:hypothetical protein
MAFDRQRLAIYWRKLRNKQAAQHVQHTSVSLDRVKRIAVLFKGDDPSHYVQVQHFLQPFRDEGKTAEAFGYIDAKDTEDLVNHAYFNRKNVNFFFIPGGNEVSYFLQKEFDLLIYAHPHFCAPLYYVAALSKAKMRVGPFLDNVPTSVGSFDLFLKLDKDSSSMEGMLEMYLKYLKMIKPYEYE